MTNPSWIDKCSKPESMSKEELLEWAEYNWNVWEQNDADSIQWWILLLWATKEDF